MNAMAKNVVKLEINDSGTTGKTLKRVAAYCRVSTSSESQLESLRVQKEHYSKLIGNHPGWVYAGLFFDEGISGTRTAGRDGLADLLSSCAAGRIDHVVVKSISRLARNTVDSLEIVRKLLGQGVTVFFEKENIDTGNMDGELMLSILSSLAEDESFSNSENNKWTCLRRFRDGTYKIGYAPLGYSVEYGRFSVIPEEADAVRLIFREYLAGKGVWKICRILEEKGIRPRKGGRWSTGSVTSVLRNEKYVGDCLFQKTYTEDFKRKSNGGEREMFLVSGHHEAIVSREEFDRVQELLREGVSDNGIERSTGKYSGTYAFSGKIRCGECGGTFRRTLQGYNIGKPYAAWVCRKHVSPSGGCGSKAVRNDALEASFCNMFNKLVWSAGFLLKPYADSFRKQEVPEETEIGEVSEALAENREKRGILSGLLAEGLIDPGVFARENAVLLEEASRLTLRKEGMRGESDGKESMGREAALLMKTLTSRGMLDAFDPELFVKVVDHMVVVSRNEVEFHLKCGLCLKEEI